MLGDREAPEEFKYRLCLRPFGAEFDRISARYITLLETDQAFIWHAFAHGDLKQPVYGVVSLEDLPQFIQRREVRRKRKEDAKTLPPQTRRLFGRHSQQSAEEPAQPKPPTNHPLVPESYEDFFRSLGVRLDKERATQVVVVETSDSFIVDYHMYLPLFVRADPQMLERAGRYKEFELYRPEIQAMIADAQSNRGNPYFK